MINNDDISEELAERINECVIWHDGPQVDVAKVVGLLLEAGVVSPPVYCVRNSHTGDLVRNHAFGHVGSLVLIQGKPIRKNHEHWKGQTE